MLLAEVNPTDRGHVLEDVMGDVVRQFNVDYATCQPIKALSLKTRHRVTDLFLSLITLP